MRGEAFLKKASPVFLLLYFKIFAHNNSIVMNDIVKILVFSAVAALYLFIISKIIGKKLIAQLDVIDYMLGIAVSSIAAEMATDLSDTPIYHYLIAMTFFFIVNLIIVFLERKGTRLKKFFKGKPLMLIYEGKINYKDLKKSKIDVDDLIAKSREKGYFNLNDIEYAIFENSGQLSVMPKGGQRPPVIADFDIRPTGAKLPYYLINDSQISYSGLRTLNRDKNWLFNRAGVQSEDDLKNIILASYDEEKDEMIISKKT